MKKKKDSNRGRERRGQDNEKEEIRRKKGVHRST